MPRVTEEEGAARQIRVAFLPIVSSALQGLVSGWCKHQSSHPRHPAKDATDWYSHGKAWRPCPTSGGRPLLAPLQHGPSAQAPGGVLVSPQNLRRKVLNMALGGHLMLASSETCETSLSENSAEFCLSDLRRRLHAWLRQLARSCAPEESTTDVCISAYGHSFLGHARLTACAAAAALTITSWYFLLLPQPRPFVPLTTSSIPLRSGRTTWSFCFFEVILHNKDHPNSQRGVGRVAERGRRRKQDCADPVKHGEEGAQHGYPVSHQQWSSSTSTVPFRFVFVN